MIITAVWTGSEMICLGWSRFFPLEHGRKVQSCPDSWSATSIVNAPSARSQHTAVWTGTQMIVWGGTDGTNRTNTGGSYTPGSDSWISTSTRVLLRGALNTRLPGRGRKLVVWGGTDGSSRQRTRGQDIHRFEFVDSNQHRPAPIRPHEPHGFFGQEPRMIVWGGGWASWGPYYNTGGSYDPAWIHGSPPGRLAPLQGATGIPQSRTGWR